MAMTLRHLLEDVLDNLEDSEDVVSATGGQLDAEGRSAVAEHLDVAIARIDEAIGRLDAEGELDAAETGGDLTVVARRCSSLAQDAFGLEDEALASKLRTIKSLIERDPGGFRTMAGIA